MSDVLSLTLPNPVARVRARRKRKPPRHPLLVMVLITTILVTVGAGLDAAASLVLGWYPHAVRKMIVAGVAWKTFHAVRRYRSFDEHPRARDVLWCVAYAVAVNLDAFLPDTLA